MSDGQDLATTGDGPGTAVAKRDSASVIAMILDAARDPSVDAAKVETMANLAIKLQDRELEQEFNRDLNAALLDMPRITKRGEIVIPSKTGGMGRVQSRYARFEDIDLAVRPVLARCNLAIRFELGSEGAMVTCRPIISHRNGYTWRGDAVKMPMDDSGNKNKTQGVGSAASYAKRHAMKAALNIIEDGEDIDGLGSLPDDQLNDRQVRILAHAERAVEARAYDAYFDGLDAGDRAWLVTSGRHAEFGGGPVALPATPARGRARPSTPTARPQPEPEPEAEHVGETRGGDDGQLGLDAPPTRPQITPRPWVDRFKSDVAKCKNTDTLDVYMDGKRDALTRLQASDKALWDECDAAYREQLAAIMEA